MKYDVAQVCPNGHVANASFRTHPEFSREFCEHCGEKTTMACPKCDEPIRGYYLDTYAGAKYRPPSFCHHCGTAFPWTERKQQAAIDLFIDECQDAAAREEFKTSIEQITKDTPQAQVAGRRITRLVTKFAKESGKALRDIVVDIAAEGVKRAMLPHG